MKLNGWYSRMKNSNIYTMFQQNKMTETMSKTAFFLIKVPYTTNMQSIENMKQPHANGAN